ncbi:MAG: 30S ribosomal protein S15 [Parcubacteria group bacterium]|nr:30S ribosomal protein S15 [Parcubacteria group bacterium]|tara:strand:- start:3349 stop:3702 length:354 start_codon:yes stop_codon:yes gene_type:complete
MLDKRKKERIIAKYKTHTNDTGSSQVQIAILTEEIKELTKHLKTHKKDFSSRRGLLKKVAERRRLLNYLKREDEKGFEKLVKDLKLKVKLVEREQPKEEFNPEMVKEEVVESGKAKE